MGDFRPTALEDFYDDSLFSLEKALKSIISKDNDENCGYSYFDAAYQYRRLAICTLLMKADVNKFHSLLLRSAFLRLHFLTIVEKGHMAEPLYICASRNHSFINALCANNLDLAIRIAELSEKRMHTEVEYEEDFYLYHFLHSLTLSLHSKKGFDLDQILSDWYIACEGTTDYYLNLCRALLNKKTEDFHLALCDVITNRINEYDRIKENFGPNEERRATEGFLFLNGIAFLKLAKLLKIPTESGYYSIPDIALISSESHQDSDSWKSMDI